MELNELSVGDRVVIRISRDNCNFLSQRSAETTLYPSRVIGICTQSFTQYCFIVPEDIALSLREVERLKSYDSIKMIDNITDYVGCHFKWTQRETKSDFLIHRM